MRLNGIDLGRRWRPRGDFGPILLQISDAEGILALNSFFAAIDPLHDGLTPG